MSHGSPPARTHAAAHPARPHLRLRACSHQPCPSRAAGWARGRGGGGGGGALLPTPRPPAPRPAALPSARSQRCPWQERACRAGLRALVLGNVPVPALTETRPRQALDATRQPACTHARRCTSSPPAPPHVFSPAVCLPERRAAFSGSLSPKGSSSRWTRAP